MSKSNEEFFDAMMILVSVQIGMAFAWATLATWWEKRGIEVGMIRASGALMFLTLVAMGVWGLIWTVTR